MIRGLLLSVGIISLPLFGVAFAQMGLAPWQPKVQIGVSGVAVSLIQIGVPGGIYINQNAAVQYGVPGGVYFND